MQIIDCFGPPKARGHAHGEMLRDQIRDALEAWENATMAALGVCAPKNMDAYCAKFIADTTLIERARAATPSLYAEMAGIAEGADQPLERIAAYNLMDEQWWYDAPAESPPPGCSLIAAPIAGGHVLAQNMDLPEHMTGSQVALRLAGPDMPQTVVLSAAGLIGLTGANDAGLAIGVNTLLMLHHARNGLPVAFAMRHALAAMDGADAQARLAGVGHASGQHYAMVTQRGIRSVECSATSCVPYPVPDDGILLHTNHPLISDEIDGAAQARLDSAGFNKSSTTRLEWLKNQRERCRSARDVQALFDDAAAPICMRAKTNGGSNTFASVLYEMTERPTVHMRQGIAQTAEWETLAFSDFGATR